jgi:hypothetical protein
VLIAQDLFDELIADAGHIFQRTEALHGRIERLKLKVTQLDSNVEEGELKFYKKKEIIFFLSSDYSRCK